MSWEDLDAPTPMAYSRAIGACLNHLLSRVEVHPKASRTTAQVAYMIREQFEILSLEADEAAAREQMKRWMEQDPKMKQVLDLLSQF